MRMLTRGDGSFAYLVPWLLSLGIGLLAILIRLSIGPLTIDDAYITFRYARNVAAGVGFVYNPNQHVLGTTTPLWTLLLAVGDHLGLGSLPKIALAVGATADGVTTFLLFWLARRLDLPTTWAGLVSLLFAGSAASIAFTTGGMETPLFIMWVISAVLADVDDRPTLAGTASALATLTRPEGILVTALIIGRRLLTDQRKPWRIALINLALLAPWIAFAFMYFGSPIPQSMDAKAVVYSSSDPLANAKWLLVQLGLPGLSVSETVVLPTAYDVGLFLGRIVLVVGIAALPRLVRFVRRRPETLPAVAFAPALALAYAIAGFRNVMLFHWYLVPLVPFYLLGFTAFLRLLTRHRAWLFRAGSAILLMSWMALGLNLWRNPSQSPFRPLGTVLVREDAYIAAAQFLAPQLKPGDVVALPEIGAFGYHTSVNVLDTVGLVSPIATRYYPLPLQYQGHALPADLVRDARPNYIVSIDVFLQNPLTMAPWFIKDYHLIKVIDAPFPAWNAREVYVYQRVN